jgi:hypothetical protein
MKMNKIQRVSIAVCLMGLMPLMISCSSSALSAFTDLFNSNFVTESGLVENASTQVTPDLPEYLWVKVTNQTEYAAQVVVAIKRAERTETFQTVVMANQTIGKVVEACNSDTDPVLSLYIPDLSEAPTSTTSTTASVSTTISQCFVTVDGVPVVIATSQLPGILNVRTNFNCGDTVEFVIHDSFADTNRFQISALIYYGNTTDSTDTTTDTE